MAVKKKLTIKPKFRKGSSKKGTSVESTSDERYTRTGKARTPRTAGKVTRGASRSKTKFKELGTGATTTIHTSNATPKSATKRRTVKVTPNGKKTITRGGTQTKAGKRVTHGGKTPTYRKKVKVMKKKK